MSGSETYNSITGNETYINPLLSKVGDFTVFYVTISICTVLLGCMIILNIIFCCSRYSEYWTDRHTGNRWLVSIFSATPHKQPPLDLTELESQYMPVQFVHPLRTSEEYLELRKRESESLAPSSYPRQQLQSSQEYLELQKRESDI